MFNIPQYSFSTERSKNSIKKYQKLLVIRPIFLGMTVTLQHSNQKATAQYHLPCWTCHNQGTWQMQPSEERVVSSLFSCMHKTVIHDLLIYLCSLWTVIRFKMHCLPNVIYMKLTHSFTILISMKLYTCNYSGNKDVRSRHFKRKMATSILGSISLKWR